MQIIIEDEKPLTEEEFKELEKEKEHQFEGKPYTPETFVQMQINAERLRN